MKIKGREDNVKSWKDLEKLIEDLGDSKHEMLRGNVVHAAR